MKARITLFVVLALALASTACQPPAQEAGALSEGDIAAIKSIGPALDEAVVAGDWGAVVEFFTEDVFLMPPNGSVIQGRAAMTELAESIPVTITEHKTELVEIDGYGDLAYARGTVAEAYAIGGLAEPMEWVGKALFILRKQPNGSWLIAVEIWNSDLALPEEGSGT